MRLWALGKLNTNEDHDDHQPTPDEELDEAASAFGLRVEHTVVLQDPVFHLFPESLPSWEQWHQVQTQWRTAGMDGSRTGLDYAGVESHLRASGYGHGRRRSLRRALGDVKAMEIEAMNVWAALQAKKAGRRRG